MGHSRRRHLTRYCGVLSSHARLRSQIMHHAPPAGAGRGRASKRRVHRGSTIGQGLGNSIQDRPGARAAAGAWPGQRGTQPPPLDHRSAPVHISLLSTINQNYQAPLEVLAASLLRTKQDTTTVEWHVFSSPGIGSAWVRGDIVVVYVDSVVEVMARIYGQQEPPEHRAH